MSKVKPCEGCGARCMYEDPDPATDEPCYGEVTPITRKQWEGDGFVGEWYEHACEGHKHGGLYIAQQDSELSGD